LHTWTKSYSLPDYCYEVTESLYKAGRNNYFLHSQGAIKGRKITSESIIPLTNIRAFVWLSDEVLEAEFGGKSGGI